MSSDGKLSITGTLSISAATQTAEQTSYTVAAGSTYALVDLSGAGRLHEVTVISPSPSFKLTITVDGTVIWDKSYSDAEAETDEVVMVSAFQREDGKYVYHLSDIPYTSNLKVEVTNTGTSNITFDLLFAKWEVT